MSVITLTTILALITTILYNYFKEMHRKIEYTDDHFKISCTSPISIQKKKFILNSNNLLTE